MFKQNVLDCVFVPFHLEEISSVERTVFVRFQFLFSQNFVRCLILMTIRIFLFFCEWGVRSSIVIWVEEKGCLERYTTYRHWLFVFRIAKSTKVLMKTWSVFIKLRYRSAMKS